MTHDTEQKPLRLKSDHLIIENLTNELLIFDQKRNKAFCLNQKAAFVWQQCDGKTTTSQIAARLGQSLGEPVDTKIVDFALQTLSNDGLLEISTFIPLAPSGLTRRTLMQKFGVSAAMSLPLVTALLVATPKAHASSKVPSNGKGHSSPPPPPRHRGR